MPNKTQNSNQNSNQNKNKKQSPKKERLSLMIVKTLIAILLFTGMAVIVIGGGYIIVKYTLLETEEISVTTSKLEYKQGEIIELTIRNSFNKKQVIYFSDPFIEKFNYLKFENNWEPVKQVWCPCQAHCYEEKVSNIIKANGQLKYQWDQTESYCTNNPAWYSRQEISNQVESSRYRFRIEVDKIGIIYSNEFIIAREDVDQRKVYENEEYGFELKYPEDWYQRDNYQGTDIMLLNTDKEIVRGGLRPDDYWLLPYSKRNPKYTDNWVGIGINVYQKPVDFNWDSWIKNEFPVVEKYEVLDYNDLNNNLKGIKVEKLNGIFYGNPNIFLDGESKILNIRFFSAFPFDVDDDGLNYFEQVISTFKFIETDISNWQTYRNNEFGFEIKYPKDWEYNFDDVNSSFQGSILMENSVAFRPVNDSPNADFEVAFSSLPIKNNDYCLNNKEESIYIDSVKAVKCKLSLDLDSYKDEPVFGYEGDLGTKVFFSKDSNHNYVIYFKDETMNEHKTVLNQILSSFKFID
ncbi:MAG: hypothetical protein KAI71_01065 [Candidatus Pacebacteria bacterium]|nr:hypothetical protein [Candidatus Paceibacterota bacterium]